MDHLGLVAGLVHERGSSEVLDRPMHHTPETRLVTGGSAVNALVLPGLVGVNPQRSRVPRCCRNQPTPRLIASGVEAQPRHDDTRGRALARRDEDGVTTL